MPNTALQTGAYVYGSSLRLLVEVVVGSGPNKPKQTLSSAIQHNFPSTISLPIAYNHSIDAPPLQA